MRTGERVPRVSPDTPMTETIHEMSRKMMGITAVVNGTGRLVGVISDGDLRRLLERDPKLLSRTAGDCLHANPRTIGADEFASTALDRMEECEDHLSLHPGRRRPALRRPAHARPAVGGNQ